MSTLSKDVSVSIEGETFSLVKIPDVRSQLVKRSKEDLLNGSLDLASLVNELAKLGSFIRVAYNGVAGSTKLQIKVQKVGYKITKLADKSAVTVQNFKSASNSVLQELQGTYEFLLDGLEEMALETLSLLSKVAENMAKAAEELHTDFDAATTDVIEALEDTQTEKGCQEDRKQKMKDEQKEFEMKRKKAEALQKDAVEAEELFNKLYHQAQEREDEALASEGNILKSISNSLSSMLGAGVSLVKGDLEKFEENVEKIASNSIYKDAKDQANKEKMKHLDDMKKQREIRMEANQQCIEFVERIKNCKDNESLADVAIDALHNSVGALKSLSAIMMNAALFWRQMQKHCEALAQKDMQQMVERAMKLPDEKRLKVWTSTTFKRKAVGYYSKWVALDDICGAYMLQIKETRQDLHAYLIENPTIGQSRENVRRLAESFGDTLKQEQKKIADKDTKEQEVIKALAAQK
jgi:hypothetical protein